MKYKLIRLSLILAMTICLNACDKREEFSTSINNLKEQASENLKEVDSQEIVKITEPAVEPEQIPKLEDYYIEIEVAKEKVPIKLKDITLLYDEFVLGYNLEKSEELELFEFQMSRMRAELVYKVDGNYYYLINYNCGVKLSDYILLKYDGVNVYEVYLTNGIYTDNKVSDDGAQIAINFIQTSGDIVYNNLIRFDLVNMKVEPLYGVTEYKYQMKSYEWADGELNVEYSIIEEDN